MTDFINDAATHSAGVLAAQGKKAMLGLPNWDNLRTAVTDWLEDAEVLPIDLDVMRGMLAALSLVRTRLDVYLTDVEHNHMDLLLAEVSATLIDIFENPRVDLWDFSD